MTVRGKSTFGSECTLQISCSQSVDVFNESLLEIDSCKVKFVCKVSKSVQMRLWLD